MTEQQALFEYLLRQSDDTMILGQRLSEWCGLGPILEEDIALTNIALDLIGQATELYGYAAQVENKGRTADDLAFLRLEREYKNVLLVEQKNGDFGKTIVRQFLFDNFQLLNYTQLLNSTDAQVAAIAEKSIKEVKYHLKHSAEWVIRLGDGTEESHNRIQNSVDDLMRFADELFFQNEVNDVLQKEGIVGNIGDLKPQYYQSVNRVLHEATLTIPEIKYHQKGGRKGIHSEHMGFLIAEMQYMQRTFPGMEW